MIRKIFPLVALTLSALFPLAAFAISYQPGQTLDPSCAPSDPTCVVVPNTTSSSFTATSSSATSTFAGNIQVAGTASSTNAVVSGSLTLGNLNGILKAVAGVITSALVNLASDVTGILGIVNGGTGTSSIPSYGQLLVGNGSGGYTLSATSSLGINSGTWGNINGSLANQSDLQSALNAKLATSSLPAVTSLASLASVGTITSGVWQASPIGEAYGGTGFGSYSPGDILYADGTGNLERLPVGSTGNVLQIQAGLPAWGTSASSSGGSAGGVWATTTNSLAIYPVNTAYQVVVGGSATSTMNSIFEVHGGEYVSGNFGVATTSPATALSVSGNGYLTGGLGVGVLNSTAGSLQTAGNALIGGSVSGSSFSGAGTGLTGTAASLSIGGNAGAVTNGVYTTTFNGLFDNRLSATTSLPNITSLANLASVGTITSGAWQGSPIGAAYGGTGSSTLSGILVGNGTSAVNSLAFSGPLSLSDSILTLGQAGGSNNGFLASADWTNFNGKLASSSLSASYPLAFNSSSGIFSLGFGTTTSNTWSNLQTFNGGASTTNISASGEGFFGTASTTHLNVGTGAGFLQANALGVVSATSTFSLVNNVFGTLGIGFGGTGLASTPSYGQILVGNGSGYTLTSTSSLGIASAVWGNITGTLANQTDLQTALNGKLSSTSLATSALLAGLVSDETGSGSLVFATSPTFAGTPVFSGGLINYSTNSTSTIPNNTPYAWTISTSTSATPLVDVDSSGSVGAVSLGSTYATSSTVLIGASNQPSILQFAGTSTIEGAGTGQQITIGANSDIVNLGVNVEFGTTTPWSDIASAPALADFTSGGIVQLVMHDTASTQEEKLSSDGTGFYIDSAGATSGTNNNIIFRVSNTNSNYKTTEAARITSAGLFAVGTTSPWAQVSASSTSATPTFAVQQNSTGPAAVFLGGNVGIGTTSPGSIFSIAGVGNWTAGTSTMYSTGGINITGGCFSINGACITGGGGGTSYTFSYPLINAAGTISESLSEIISKRGITF